jgi:hypothetical protein
VDDRPTCQCANPYPLVHVEATNLLPALNLHLVVRARLSEMVGPDPRDAALHPTLGRNVPGDSHPNTMLVVHHHRRPFEVLAKLLCPLKLLSSIKAVRPHADRV